MVKQSAQVALVFKQRRASPTILIAGPLILQDQKCSNHTSKSGRGLKIWNHLMSSSIRGKPVCVLCWCTCKKAHGARTSRYDPTYSGSEHWWSSVHSSNGGRCEHKSGDRQHVQVDDGVALAAAIIHLASLTSQSYQLSALATPRGFVQQW
jgi:hypothetical protein